MTETINSSLNILYVGRDQSTTDMLRDSGHFNLTIMKNPLAAIYWLTDNQFKIFNLDKDTRFEVTYEEKQTIDAIVCELLLPEA
jgi:hypothetical protein